ncbi:MAG TPA: transcription termination/antitermination protein NusG [Syntrophales bacterium]|nr:transcription termination/antitermination protein NusG [Syntrophales bacterium]HOM06756.1 transcription termination/antitermination protein NusG [Syntrophales bacterium]HON99549.1 transcription termination/antitermination protein NusG [Syntrophales bacterium]HPC00716.1 transcription termination/antitermination protein NusG [Syntrophales bacterium]HPQ06086.1 transcription termination/antitermination protein NusG [Syntrophales bacterium]
MAHRWYVVHTYSGFENRVKRSLMERVQAAGKQEYFSDVLIPEEDVVELVSGEKKTSKRKFFPGYILVRMELNDETWHLVKNTPKVTGFIGSKDKPSPIQDKDVEMLRTRIDEGTLKPKPKFKFDVGDHVRIIDGPFTNFEGVIDEVKPEKGKLRVIVSIFGRSTPVELDFIQVVQS